MALLAGIQLLLPRQIASITSGDGWHHTLIVFGLVNSAAGVIALVAYPLAGALSDRTASRYGRRRPWIAGGVGVYAVAFLILGVVHGVVWVTLGWALSVVGFCVCTSGLTSMISDEVPIWQRGFVSGWIGVPQALGLVVGVAVAGTAVTSQFGGYGVLALLLVIFSVPLLAASGPQPHDAIRARAAQRLSLNGLLRSLWLDPRKHPDFGWTLLSRVMVNLANALGTGLLLYFFRYDLRLHDPQGFLTLTSVIYVLCAAGASVLFGRLSDRLQRRKLFVLLAGVIEAVAALLLAIEPSTVAAIAGGMLLGVGTGTYYSVDQALVTQVLPNPDDYGKDLAIMNLALIVPQTFGPLVAALLVIGLGGFGGLFWITALIGLAGAGSICRVRSVA